MLTENWKPSGTGGEASRGWGIVVESRRIAHQFAAVFDADWEGERRWSIPAGIGLGVAFAAGVAVLVGSRLLHFEG